MDFPFRPYGTIADPKDASRKMITLYQGLTAASFFLTVDVLKGSGRRFWFGTGDLALSLRRLCA
jgi:hypothetical protein